MVQRHRPMRHRMHGILVKYFLRWPIHFHITKLRLAQLFTLVDLYPGARHIGIGREVAVTGAADAVDEDDGVAEMNGLHRVGGEGQRLLTHLLSPMRTLL